MEKPLEPKELAGGQGAPREQRKSLTECPISVLHLKLNSQLNNKQANGDPFR